MTPTPPALALVTPVAVRQTGPRALALALIVLALAGASGCAAGLHLVSYEPPRAEIDADQDKLLAAVLENGRQQGWTLVSCDHAVGHAVFVTPEEALDDLRLRQRWTFQVADGVVRVAMRLEMADDGGWRTSEHVTSNDRYHQERHELARIRRLAEHGAATLAAR